MARTRLSDVAARAGVSVMTVSNVVNNRAHVRPAMRARVEAAIAELGYRPNTLARQLATGRTGTVAIALPEIDKPYFAEIARALADRCRELGYRVMIEQTIEGIEQERAVLQQRELGLVDGVLFHPVRLGTEELGEIEADFPLVLLGEVNPPPTHDHVMIDNVGAARMAVRHLISLGCRRVAFLGRERDGLTETTADRLRGWSEVLAEAGLEPAEELQIVTDGYRAPAGERAAREAVAAGLTFDGLLCRDDVLAIGAMRALHDAGRRIPEDVAVIGWDDIDLSGFIQPSLTTIAPDKADLAATALDLLKHRMDGDGEPGVHHRSAFELIVRESAPLPDRGQAPPPVSRGYSSRTLAR